MEPLISSIASSILETLITAAGKAVGKTTSTALRVWRDHKKQLEQYLRVVTNEVSFLVTYRATVQHIDEAYVEPRILDGALARTFLQPEEFQRLKAYISATIQESQEENIFSSRSHRLMLQQGTIYETRFVTIEDLMEADDLLVLGEAGSGKSALLAYLCLNRLRKERGRIPIFLNSRSILDSSIIDIVENTLSSLSIRSLGPEYVDVILDLYVDGLDEVSTQRYREVCLELASLKKRYPGMRLTASCRSAAYGGELSFLRDISLAPFDKIQASEFARRWFKGLEKGPTAEDFLSAVRRNNRLSELVGHPLLLSLMCNAFSRYLDFSRRQSTLFEQCVSALLWQWDAQRTIKRESPFIDLDLQKRIWLHAWLAFCFHHRRSRFLRRSDVVDALGQLLPNFGIESKKSSDILVEISSHHGLMVGWTEETYGFGHLALQEFLAGKWLSDERRWVTLVTGEKLTDPWWRNVIGIAIGTLSDATEALERIVSCNDSSEVERFGIAAHCLRYDPIVEPAIRQEIVRKILNWYHNGNALQRDAAVLMLIGIEDDWTTRQIRVSLSSRLPGREDADVYLRRPQGRGGNWFAVLGEFKTLAEATRLVKEVGERQQRYTAGIYLAENGFYAVSLGGFLSRDEAKARIEFAQTTRLTSDAYVWESDQWRENF